MKLIQAGLLALSMVAASIVPSKAYTVVPASGSSLGLNPNINFTISGLNAGEAFDINYTFSLSSLSGLSNFKAGLTDASGQVQGLTVDIWSGSIGGTLVASGTGFLVAGVQFAQAIDSFAANGDYILQIFGKNSGNGPTNLQVAGNTFTVAVPEPSTWALMGIGFACLGFMAYRRRGSAASFRFI
ncbi:MULTISPECIES: FxDxF family PEP-CTERM protein [unclassified Bradyrhizobium]|uniref:FxDxF family PEP-CTERM protein n=1 Tax=unclassified Bradyrhizobium TaxID=2631580 RepID=UPI0028EE1095|nr:MULTISPECIES: FxDxF family PEP-CTERM protein [unclassified Bradyrhizobium]